jgi:deoxycytidine triphosphate deaminase
MILQRAHLHLRDIDIQPPLEPSNEHVTVDLHVGDAYQVPGSPTMIALGSDLKISPRDCRIVQTREKIKTPSNAFGILVSKGSLTAKGLLVGNTKIDPLFSGSLNIAVFNSGPRPLRLKRGDPFCSIFFQTLESPIPSAPWRGPISAQKYDKPAWKDLLEVYQANIGTIVLSVLLAFVAQYCANRFFPAPQPASASFPSPSPSPAPTK